MNSNINEDSKSKLSFNNAEKNKAPLSFFSDAKETETQKKESVPINIFNGNIFNNINAYIYNSPYLPFNYCNYNLNIRIPNNINIIEDRTPIFQVNNRNMRLADRITHSGDSKDNIRQIIITHFTNFFVKFVNNIINKKIDEKIIIEYHIGYKIKYKIKFVDIVGFSVKKFLSDFATLKIKNKSKKKNYLLKENSENIKNEMFSSLPLLFNKQVIEIFKDIYAKDIKKENDNELDLSNYGLEGQILILNKEILTYVKLKEKYKNNEIKTNIMDQIVDSIKNFKKKNLFTVEK